MSWPSPTRGDAAIALSVVLLAWALATPALRARSFRVVSGAATADVEAITAAARASRASTGRWPAPADAGSAPTGLAGSLPLEAGFTTDHYTLEWTTFEVVDYVEVEVPPPAEAVPGDAPPAIAAVELRPVGREVGALNLRSSNTDLLAELLRHFGPERSFVRDSTWTLLVDEGPTGSPLPSP